MPPATETEAAASTGDTPEAPGARDGLIIREGRALGSTLRLHVSVPGPPAPAGIRAADEARSGAADAAWTAVRDEFDAVDLALSRFRDDSELTRFNRLAGTGQVVVVSRRLRTALATVDRARRLTDGRFDATVLGALERVGEHGANLTGPIPNAGHDPHRATGGDVPRWSVRAPHAPLDMGGIGKGLALRWAAARAASALPADAGLLLEAGGDLVQAGIAPSDGWLVGIEDPVATSGPDAEPIAVVSVREGGLATSSVRVRHWVGPDGQPIHHLLDPATGRPARTGLIAVSVAAADPAWAEVWTKALFLAGRGRIGDEARRRGLAAWWVDERGSLGMTPDARLRSTWVAEDRLG